MIDPRSIPWAELRCVHGDRGSVVGIFCCPEGCAVRSEQVQPLCRQHVISLQSTGSITLVAWRPGEGEDGSVDNPLGQSV